MKLLIVGASGTIGQAVVQNLSPRHDIIEASRRRQVAVDLSDPASIAAMFASIGKIDGIVSTAGSGKFGPLASLADEDYAFGLGNKLMGQVNLVRHGVNYLNDGGSITLTSGILADRPNPNSVLITTLNTAVEGFVRAASLDLPRNIRLNVVSPPMVKETAEKMGWGSNGVPARTVAALYIEAVEGDVNGQVIPFDTNSLR